MRSFILLLVAGWSLEGWSAIPRQPISRDTSQFVRSGIFEGGENVTANLEELRLGKHPSKGFERWVVDFSDSQRKVGTVAPRFQLRYEPGETFLTEQGQTKFRRPPRFLLELRSLGNVYVDRDRLKALAEQSSLIRSVQLYPPIEGGDRVMEWILSREVDFSAHQPLEKAGRLVLDIRPR